jgi:heme/copper-type cytochrome/quinol oxidase subunit 2
MIARGIYFFDNNTTRYKQITHHTALEIVWTVLPSLLLLVISLPSFALLYAIDEITKPTLTFKAIGHQ